ncbi:MAG TPA: hypothetical protein DCQ93_01000 [Bacteroidetes bacterium]|nr:hypothetical protein [Bacteroidota bacterium]
MSEETIDRIGEAIWFMMFLTPLITIPLVWRLSKARKIFRIIIGLVLAFALSLFFFFISLGICFRNGLGP